MVLVVTARTFASRQIPREMERADRLRVPVIPFRAEAAEPSGPLAYYLAGLQWGDATAGRPEEHVAALAGAAVAEAIKRRRS